MMREFGTIVGGRQVKGSKWLDVLSPYTGEKVGRVSSIGSERLEEILRDTHAAKIQLSRHERHEILNRMAEGVASRREEVSRLITDESGLCLKDSQYEADRVFDVLRFAAIKSLDDDSEIFPCDPERRDRRGSGYSAHYRPIRRSPRLAGIVCHSVCASESHRTSSPHAWLGARDRAGADPR